MRVLPRPRRGPTSSRQVAQGPPRPGVAMLLSPARRPPGGPTRALRPLPVPHPRCCRSVRSRCVFQRAPRKSALLARVPSHSAGGKGSRPAPPKRQACVSVLQILIRPRGPIPCLCPPTDPTSFEDSGLFVTHRGVSTVRRKRSTRGDWPVTHRL